MRHQEFLAGVATRGGFDRTEDARHAADAVLATLAAHLPDDDRRALADALPTLLEQESGVDDESAADTPPTSAQVVSEVAGRAGWTTERSRYALWAVVGQLAAEDPDLGSRLERAVPSIARTPGPAVPPDVGSEGSQGRPQPVDADELARALDRLVDWVTDDIQLAAARAIADQARGGADAVVPDVFDEELVPAVARAVEQAGTAEESR